MKVPIWLKIAYNEIGTHEVRGGENPRILEYHACTELHAQEDEIAWCSAFINWVMKQANVPRTNSAAAKSWLEWGKSIFDEPQVGAVVIFSRNGGGHVGLLIDWDDDGLKVLGGNQSDEVNITRFHWDNVLDIRWPKNNNFEMIEMDI